jgi:hypothetical protein
VVAHGCASTKLYDLHGQNPLSSCITDDLHRQVSRETYSLAIAIGERRAICETICELLEDKRSKRGAVCSVVTEGVKSAYPEGLDFGSVDAKQSSNADYPVARPEAIAR